MMQEYEVEHTVVHKVKADSHKDAREKSRHFVRPLIDKDAANKPLDWGEVLSSKEFTPEE